MACTALTHPLSVVVQREALYYTNYRFQSLVRFSKKNRRKMSRHAPRTAVFGTNGENILGEFVTHP